MACARFQTIQDVTLERRSRFGGPMRIETERKVRRWREQRWLLDQVIQSRGIDWDQGRTGKILRNCGPAVQSDLQEICGRIQKFVDIPKITLYGGTAVAE